MTPELSGYNPDQTPQGDLNPNRLVFVPETQKHLEFDIRAAAEEQGKVVGADSPEAAATAMVEAAYADDQEKLNQAATLTPEHGADQAALTRGIGANAETFAIIRPMVEAHGFDFDSATAKTAKDDWGLAG